MNSILKTSFILFLLALSVNAGKKMAKPKREHQGFDKKFEHSGVCTDTNKLTAKRIFKESIWSKVRNGFVSFQISNCYQKIVLGSANKSKYDVEVKIGSAICKFSLNFNYSINHERRTLIGGVTEDDIKICASRVKKSVAEAQKQKKDLDLIDKTELAVDPIHNQTNETEKKIQEKLIPTIDDILADFESNDYNLEESSNHGEVNRFNQYENNLAHNKPYEMHYLNPDVAPVVYDTYESYSYENVKTFCDEELKNEIIDLFISMANKRIVKGITLYAQNVHNCDFHDNNGFVIYNATLELNSEICHFKVQINEKKKISVANSEQILASHCKTYLTSRHYVSLGGNLDNFAI